jgi:hypothetical protein
MIRIKIALKSMLSLPVLHEAWDHYLLLFGAVAYCGIMFLVLKTFQYNRDRS